MKKIEKMIFKNLDDLYRSSKRVSKRYGMKSISIVYLEKIIEIVKSNEVDKKEKEAHAIQQGFFDVLDKILETCKTQAKEIGSEGVSFGFLKKVIGVVKLNYKIGARKAA